MLNHCLLMTAYRPESAPVINQLISHLPDNWGFYIHYDKKSKVSPERIDPRAHFLSKYKVYWGAKEHMDAILDMLREAYDSDASYDYFHMITGEDYWTCPPMMFDSVVNPPYSYIRYYALPREGWFNGGYELLQYKQLSSYGDIRKGLFRFLNRVVKWSQILLGIKQPLPDYPLYCGLANWSLHRSAVENIFNSPIAKDLYSHTNNTFDPEELFFQTVLMNSPLKDKLINNSLRYIDWSSVPAPKRLSEEDLDAVLQSGTLFCRKVSDIRLARVMDSRLGL